MKLGHFIRWQKQIKPSYSGVLINHMVFFDITGLTSWQIREKQMVAIHSLVLY
jgi:hypothetical protein